MDTVDPQHPPFVSALQLASLLGRADAPFVLDVRKAEAYDADPRLLPGALRVAPGDLDAATAALPRDRDIVACCVHGHEVSQGAARSLRAAGLDAAYLEHGIMGWINTGLPTMGKVPDLELPATPGHPTRWVTRERPKIDRIACPWLIRRFIDPTAQFLYVPAGEVVSAAERENAIPYDVPGVRISHRGAEGELCSFDALIADCGLDDPALHDLARIVRGADTGKPELTPQSPGLLAVSLGLSAYFRDDHAMLDAGMVVYDALYAWLRSARAETHNALLFMKP
ncbi:MAG: chromate resistance protein [Lysobacter sp.]|nr:chromate resistance protein [Lysobacter sp.]